MYCQKCGTQNDDNNFKCIKCGVVIQKVPVSPASSKKKNPLVVVLIVVGAVFGLIMVLGIIAAIAIPAFVGYRTKAGNAIAQAEIKNACNSAAAILAENPHKTITLDDLKKSGLNASPDVELSIADGSKDNLTIGAKHNKGNKVYMADKNCNIKEIQP